MTFVFWFSSLAAIYPYLLFPALLSFFGLFGRGKASRPSVKAPPPPITHILVVHNEVDIIATKIEQSITVLECIPGSELLVVCDHCSDGTPEVARSFDHRQIRVLESEGTRGRAGAHNYGMERAVHEFVIFSDVETIVPIETVLSMVSCLKLPDVGCVNAAIVFAVADGDQVMMASGFYWRFELWLRSLETRLGFNAFSSGPCMGIRRDLFRNLPPTGDIDFTTPLDIVAQGWRCVQLVDVKAFDSMPTDDRAEYKARVRMVSKNFLGTVTRWGWVNFIRYPTHSWVIYSHKIMRWLSPFFLLCVLISTLALQGAGAIYTMALVAQALFFLSAVAGFVDYRHDKRWPIFMQVYAFMLANAAFIHGVFRACTRSVPEFYTPTRKISS